MKHRKLYLWIIGLVIATPLGLLASGSVWGEWSSDEVKGHVGFVPQGMKSLESIWSGLLSGYNLPGFNGFFLKSAGYIISAAVGVGLIFLIFKLLAFAIPNEQEKEINDSTVN